MSTNTPDEQRRSTRPFIALCTERPGLAGTLLSLTSRESSLIEDLEDAYLGTDPAKVSAEIDVRLRAIIRTAQQARKLLKGEAGLT